MTSRSQKFDRAREAAVVPAAFDQDATYYDRLVGANPGYLDHLRLSAERLALPGRGKGLRLLDIGCGTGLSTRALVETYPEAEIVAADASAEMLVQARAKAWPENVRFVHSRAEELAAHGVAGPFDGILAAYLLRNLPAANGRRSWWRSRPADPWRLARRARVLGRRTSAGRARAGPWCAGWS